MPLADWVTLFSTEHYRHMLDGDYISRWAPRWREQWQEAVRSLGKTTPFWQPG